jgi:hypothetical protein
VRTRTLLILAVACGLVILAAGVVQLFRIAGEDDAEFSPLGSEVSVGDLDVVIESYAESGGSANVAVRLGGVDDRDAAGDFRLVVPGEALLPTGEGVDACGAVTVATQTCNLTFDVGDAAGGVRVLRISRGDDTARWELTAPQRS